MTTNFVQLDKTSKKALNFVKAATSKDRPVLANINFNGGMFACDGCRLHYAGYNPTGLEGLHEVEKVSDVIKPIDNTELNEEYPDIERVIGLSCAGNTEIKDIYFSVNAKFLIDALKQCGDSMVTFRVIDSNHPIELASRIDDDVTVYAMIMPMHCDDKQAKIDGARP